MPLKKQPKLKHPENPPAAASSSSFFDDDEEASSSEEAEEEGDEEEVAQPCESDSGSDSDHAPPPLSPNPKSKPKLESQIQASPSGTPAKSAAKRPAEESGDPKRAKKMKGVVVGSEQEKSLKPFQKVWSDEDEITIVDTADSSLLLREMFRVSGPSEDVVKEGLALIGASKREELEGKWKKLKVAELELFAELYRLASEALKSSNN